MSSPVGMEAALEQYKTMFKMSDEDLAACDEVDLDSQTWKNDTLTAADWAVLKKTCPNAVALGLSSCGVKKIELPEEDMTKLEVLDISDNPVSDVDFVKKLPNLVHFLAIGSKLDSLEKLKPLTGCTSLALLQTLPDPIGPESLEAWEAAEAAEKSTEDEKKGEGEKKDEKKDDGSSDENSDDKTDKDEFMEKLMEMGKKCYPKEALMGHDSEASLREQVFKLLPNLKQWNRAGAEGDVSMQDMTDMMRCAGILEEEESDEVMMEMMRNGDGFVVGEEEEDDEEEEGDDEDAGEEAEEAEEEEGDEPAAKRAKTE